MLVTEFTDSVKKMAENHGFESKVKVRSREDNGMVVEIIVTRNNDLFNHRSATFMAPCDSDYTTVTRMFNDWVSHIARYGVPA